MGCESRHLRHNSPQGMATQGASCICAALTSLWKDSGYGHSSSFPLILCVLVSSPNSASTLWDWRSVFYHTIFLDWPRSVVFFL